MFFTKTGSFIAWLLFGLGLLSLVSGFAIVALGDQSMAKQLFGAPSTGKMIDQGQIWILLGVALGIAVEVSRKLTAMMEYEDEE